SAGPALSSRAMRRFVMSRVLPLLAAAVVLVLGSLVAVGKPPPFVDDPNATPSAAPAAGSARPAAPEPLTGEQKMKQNALFQEAQALIEKEQWKEAGAKLREALAIGSDLGILLYLGFTEQKLDKLLNAKKLYAEVRAEAVAAKQRDMEARAATALE